MKSKSITPCKALKKSLQTFACASIIGVGGVFSLQAESSLTAISQNQLQQDGVVLDNAGIPIIGANVVVKGTTRGTVTNFDGAFSLDVKTGEVLVFSYLGYVTQEIEYEGKPMKVVLQDENMALEGVVVVGFGTTKKANLTGSVSAVGSKDIEGIPASNVTSLLQGKLPGVAITQASGQPGNEESSIRVRGVGTMNNASPMVIVDGLEGSMNDLNPNDIESISVLKDAAAAAIYGTRAANGVILITTKRGKEGKTKVTYNGYVGVQEAINRAKPVDSWDYAIMLNEAYANEGKRPVYTDEDIRKFKDGSSPDTHPNTDWNKAVLSGSGIVHNHNLNIMGGTEKNKYVVSMGYFDQDGIVENSGYNRYNLRFNMDSKLSKYLTWGITSSLIYSQKEMPRNITTNEAGIEVSNMNRFFLALNRFSSAVVNKYSTGEWGSYNGIGSPEAAAREGGLVSDEILRGSGSSFLELKITDGLFLKGIAGVNYFSGDTYNHFREMTFYGGEVIGPNSVSTTMNTDMTTTLQALLNYDKKIGDQAIKILLGASRESMVNRYLYAFRRNMPNGELTDLNAGETDGWKNAGKTERMSIGSYFGRINYDYKSKYLLESNVRIDGSSKFSQSNQWGVFPSFSAAWRLSEEEFMSETKSWLDDVKVRGSWGKLGNHRTGNFAYLQLINLGSSVYPFTDELVTGAAQTKSNNPDISWETTTELDLGVDLSFMNGTFNLTFDYYDRYTDDILTVIPASYIYGLDAPTTNSGAMSNKGIEITAGINSNIGKFQYNLTGYFAKNKNNVEIFPSPSTGDNIRKEGIPWDSYYGYECIGKYQDIADLESSPKHHKNCGVGDLKFKDQNGDGKINAQDKIVLGNTMPNITYGFNVNLTYKSLNLLASFQGASDVYREYNDAIFFPMVKGDNAWEMHQDRTIVENGTVVKEGYFPRLHTEPSHNQVRSSFTVLDASYLRLKNLQLAYTLPEKWMSKLHIGRAQVYVSGTNLLTFSDLPVGLDPEYPNNGGAGYPQISFYTLGLDINF